MQFKNLQLFKFFNIYPSGLEDPDYVHAIFVSNCPNIYAAKSGTSIRLKLMYVVKLNSYKHHHRHHHQVTRKH